MIWLEFGILFYKTLIYKTKCAGSINCILLTTVYRHFEYRLFLTNEDKMEQMLKHKLIDFCTKFDFF